jgi:hypothetical protein
VQTCDSSGLWGTAAACPAVAGATNSCTGTACKFTCSAGFSDCDGITSNGCEVNLNTDGKNCGACGHDCLGGACSAGACQPVVLASGQVAPGAVALDGANVYWLTTGAPSASNPWTGSVMKMPKAGGSPTAIITPAIDPEACNHPVELVVTGASIFWTTHGQPPTGSTTYTGGVYAAPLSGGSDTGVYFNGTWAGSIINDATNLYWIYFGGSGTGGTPLIMKRAISGGAPSTLATLASGGPNPSALATDGVNVYWPDPASGTISKAAISGAGSSAIAWVQPNPVRITYVGGRIYWTNQGTSATGFADGAVMTMATTGGTPTAFASSQQMAYWIVNDGTSLFWVTNTMRNVMRAPIAGGTPTAMANAGSLPGAIYGLAVDAQAVYLSAGSSILRVAK